MKTTAWLRILIGFVGAAAVSALIWLAGPMIGFAGSRPLEDHGPRIVVIVIVLILAASVAAFRFVRRRRGAERIASGLGVDDSDEPVLAEKMKEALAKLRGLRGGKANYLYDLPWYLLIGPPGSGKTTALVNSGLEFPLAGTGVEQDKLKGVGGTRYCDWWFTEDAVLIDTAGRYTTQDSDARADQKSWLAFLDLLARNRPRQPINGVLVAINLEDLLTLPAEEVALHAAAIRARLVELHTRLAVDFPVYALFTKADLVSGFMEYFGALDEKGRAQVFGTTFQTMDKSKSMLGEVPAEFDALVERLTRGLEGRLAEEKDATSRVLLFGFPAQIAALRTQLAAFLSWIFDPSQGRIGATLRGFYFTSGTQLGTPIDQLLGALTKGFGAEAVGTPAYSGHGKSFFLTDLIKKVVIGEAGWVSTSRGKRLVELGLFASLLVIAPLVIGAWLVSYAKTSDRIGQSDEAAARYGVVAAAVGQSDTVTDRDLSKVLPALHTLRYLPGGFADRRASAAGLDGFGLSQTARLNSAAETAYGTGLERLLRPRLVLRLEEQLEAKSGDPDFLFGALEAYLMLGGLETVDRRLLTDWMIRDWSENLYPGARNNAGRKELEQHLVAMLDLETGHGSFVSLNGPLIEKTRAALARVNVTERAYKLLAERAKSSLRPNWIASRAGGAGTLVVFDDRIETVEVPYFHTRPGYTSAFMERLDAIVDEMARDRWVLGPLSEEPAIAAQYDRLRPNLIDLYAKSFIASWREAIGKLMIRRLIVERPTYPLLTAAASSTSPITRLLESIRDETTLAADEPGTPSPEEAASPGPDAAGEGASAATPAPRIEAALRPYHALVEGTPGRRPIDVVLSRLDQLRSDLSRLAMNGGMNGGMNGAMNGAEASALGVRIASEALPLRTNRASLPPPFARMMEKTAEDIDREISDASVARTVETLRDTITFTCQDRIANRFPFARDAEREVALDDFTRMFGPDGLIAQFVNEHLDLAADRSGPTWKWRDGNTLAARLAPSALADFQRAAEIREAFFAAESATPGFTSNIIPPPVGTARMEVDGTMITGERRATTPIRWPGRGETHRAAISVASAGGKPAMIERTGVWALFRLLDAGRASADGSMATFGLGGRQLQYRFNSSTPSNPLSLTRLRSFHCPSGA